MYILKNALKNLMRNKNRNLLMGVIIFVLIISTTVSLAIHDTTKQMIANYKGQFGSSVNLSVDFEKLMSEVEPDENGTMAFPTAPEITSEQYLKFAESDYLKSFQMRAELGIIFEKLKAIDENKGSMGSIGSIGGSTEEYVAPTAKLIGVTKESDLTDFVGGLRKIIDGMMYKNQNDCIISSDFAKLNNLSVGSEFQIIDPMNKKKTLKLKVTGIYADATKATGNIPNGTISLGGSYMNRRNEIIVNFETITKGFETKNIFIDAKYELKDPTMLTHFDRELRGKGLPSEYVVKTDEYNYNKIVEPVMGLSKISLTLMIVILIVGGVILLFLTTMATRERKYEIGVLRAMGMKKNKIATMFLLETCILTMVTFVLGVGVGSVISQPISDSLLNSQMNLNKNNNNNNNMNFSNGSVSLGTSETETPVIKVSLNFQTVLEIGGVALLLAILSSSVGVIFIMKYEPMKILSERN